MSRLAGFMFDVSDDPTGEILKSYFPTAEDIPEHIKTAHVLTEKERGMVADDMFALVAFDNGVKLRKYAMVDRPTAALSELYFLRQAHHLPVDVVKEAAARLIEGNRMLGVQPSAQLKMAAAVGMSPLASKPRSSIYARGAKVNKIQFPTHTEAPQAPENPRLGLDTEDQDLKNRANVGGTPGSNFVVVPQFSQKERPKDAPGNIEKNAGAFGDVPGEVRHRQKSLREVSYFDLTGWDPNQSVADEGVAPSQTLLGDQYPADSYDQVKTASAYFSENWKSFHPRDRHEYCVKLAGRMAELGINLPLDSDIARYGSETYSADVDQMVQFRRSLVQEEFHPSLDLLLEKRASVSPETFAESLSEFDQMTGLRWHWDGDVPDPWFSTFGPSFEKMAEKGWTYSERGVHIRLDDLEHLARNGHTLLMKNFGDQFATEFGKSPKKVFDSLPAPTKLMVARLAMDRHGGTCTE